MGDGKHRGRADGGDQKKDVGGKAAISVIKKPASARY